MEQNDCVTDAFSYLIVPLRDSAPAAGTTSSLAEMMKASAGDTVAQRGHNAVGNRSPARRKFGQCRLHTRILVNAWLRDTVQVDCMHG